MASVRTSWAGVDSPNKGWGQGSKWIRLSSRIAGCRWPRRLGGLASFQLRNDAEALVLSAVVSAAPVRSDASLGDVAGIRKRATISTGAPLARVGDGEVCHFRLHRSGLDEMEWFMEIGKRWCCRMGSQLSNLHAMRPSESGHPSGCSGPEVVFAFFCQIGITEITE